MLHDMFCRLIWVLGLVVTTEGYLNCTSGVDLPEYESTGRYLVLGVYGAHSFVVTSNSSVYDEERSSLVHTDVTYTLEDYNGTEWSMDIYDMSMDSYDETTVPVSTVRHNFIIVDIKYLGHRQRTFHYVGLNDDSRDLCSLVLGYTMSTNAPIVTNRTKSNPVDLTFQAPHWVARVRDDTLISVFTPKHHDAPRGQITYTGGTDDDLVFQTQTVYGIPIVSLSYVNLTGQHYMTFDDLDYPPMIVGIHAEGGLPSIHATTTSEFVFDGTITTTLTTTDSAIVLHHLNLQPSMVRTSMSIDIAHNDYLIPIFATDTYLGTLDTDGFYYEPEVDAIILDAAPCASAVRVPYNDIMATLCFSAVADALYLYRDAAATLIVQFGLSAELGQCTPFNAQLIRSGPCDVLIICEHLQNGILSFTWKRVDAEGTSYPVKSSTLYNAPSSYSFVGASPETAGVCNTDDHAIFIITENPSESYSVMSSTGSGFTAQYTTLSSAYATASISHNAFHALDFEVHPTSFSSEWASAEASGFTDTAMFLTILQCPKQGNCYVTLYSQTTQTDTLSFSPVISLATIEFVASDFYENFITDTTTLTNQNGVIQHVRVNSSAPSVPSFIVNDFSQTVWDTFVVIGPTDIVTFIYIPSDPTMLYPSDYYYFGDRFQVGDLSSVRIYTAGPLAMVYAYYGEDSLGWLFNMGTMVLIESMGPSIYCHNQSMDDLPTNVSILVNVGTDVNYAQMATRTLPLYPGAAFLMTRVYDGYLDPFTGKFGFIVLRDPTLEQQASGAQAEYLMEYQAACNYSKDTLATSTAYLSLYHDAPNWCDNIALVVDGNDREPISDYLPNLDFVPFKANERADGTTIDVPYITRDTYFSYTNLDFCEGSDPPSHHLLGFPVSIYDETRVHFRYRIASFHCTSTHSQLMLGLPIAPLLLETQTLTFWYDYPLCYYADSTADPLQLPWVNAPTAQPNTVSLRFGSPLTLSASPPSPPLCDFVNQYLDAKNGCTTLTQCQADEYQLRGAQAGWDILCKTTTACIPGTDYEIVSPTPTSDRVCAPISTCSTNEHISVGPTITSDVVCRTILATCLPGQYKNLDAQIDAGVNEENLAIQCPVCVNGTTFNPACENGAAHCNPQHSETECVDINVSFTCPTGSYLSAPFDAIVGHPVLYCQPCSSCILAATDCTTTTDTVCAPQTSSSPPDTRTLRCPSGQWANPDSVLNHATCEPWRECPHGWIKIEGTFTSNRVCATLGSEEYVYEAIYITYPVLILLILAWVWINHAPSNYTSPFWKTFQSPKTPGPPSSRSEKGTPAQGRF